MSGVQVVEEVAVSKIIETETERLLVEQVVSSKIIEAAQQGRPGPPGPSSDVVLDGYTHTQAAPASTWTINHNLGRRPLVALLTTGAVEFDGQLTHMSDNQAVVSLAAAVAGTARCL